MKKLLSSLFLATLAFTAFAQNNPTPAGQGGSEVARFVANSYNCDKMLGASNDGDQLPAAYSAALNASLNEINAPADQAIAKIYARCVQQLGGVKSAKL
jgi:hypothetical protein